MPGVTTEFHSIGEDHPPYFIAEIGLNHNGDAALAKRMIEESAKAGAHGVKFQLFHSDLFIQKETALGDQGPGSLRKFFRQFELTNEEWRNLAEFARSQQIDFLASVFDRASLEFYLTLDPHLIKIASGDMDNRILIEDAVDTGLPILLSTGTADESEVERALSWITEKNKNHSVILFQCVSAYPAQPEDYNLKVIPHWKESYGHPVGLSDHTTGTALSIASIALGSASIERHVTLDKTMDGPDQSLSLNMQEFAALIRDGNEVWRSMGGDGIKKWTPSEEGARKYGRRSLFAARDLSSNEIVSRKDIQPMRPGGGFPASEVSRLLGKPAPHDIKKEQNFQ